MNSLRLTLLLSLLLSVLSTFDAPARADTTVSCTAVKDKANVGVHDDISVNMTTGNNICNFSVSGATVNGTQAQDFNAFKTAVSQLNAAVGGLAGGGLVLPLRDLLLMPSYGPQLTADTQAAFDKAIGDGPPGSKVLDTLTKCIDAFKGNNTQSFDNDGFFCTAIGAGKSASVGSDAALVPAKAGIVFGATINGLTSSTFLPGSLLQ